MHYCQKPTASYADRGFGVDRPEPDHDKPPIRSDKDKVRHGQKEKVRREDRDRRERERERDDKDFDHDGMQHMPHKRKSDFRVDDSVADQTDKGVEGAKNFEFHSISSSNDHKRAFKSKYLV